MTTKAETTEVVKQLRDAARAQDGAARAAIKLVQLMYEEAKESLVRATGDDMLRMQGVAVALKNLHRDLTTEPQHTAPGAKR